MTQKEIKQIAAAVAEILRETMQLYQKEFLSLDEAAQYAGLTKSALYKLTHNKQIPFSKPNGKMCYFKRTDLDAWLAKGRHSSNDELSAAAADYCARNRFPAAIL